MSNPLNEMAEFTGRACGVIARDLADFSKPLAESFRRGWQQAWQDQTATEPTAEPAPATGHHTPESV